MASDTQLDLVVTSKPSSQTAGAPSDRILFVTMTNDVGSDRIVSELGRQGARCAVLGSKGGFAALSRSVERHFSLPDRFGPWGALMTVRRRLTTAVTAWNPERIVPLDELAALVLRRIAGERRTTSRLRDLLVRSLGRIEGFEAASERVALMLTAARLGVRVPAFAADAHASASCGLPFPILVKRDHSSGCGGVALASDGVALSGLLRRARIKAGVKRLLANAAGFRHPPTPILLQHFVRGDLVMRTVACRDGIVLDGLTMRAVEVHPTKRASTMLQAIDHPEMDEAARRVVGALGCSGFVSFDFILDADDRAFLIEMNPRPIGSSHLGGLFGHDLAQAFLTATGAQGQDRPAAPRLAPDTIVALFPKELERDLASLCLGSAPGLFHDVPRDEPEVLEAYLRHLAALHPGMTDGLRSRLGSPETPIASESVVWTAARELCA